MSAALETTRMGCSGCAELVARDRQKYRQARVGCFRVQRVRTNLDRSVRQKMSGVVESPRMDCLGCVELVVQDCYS